MFDSVEKQAQKRNEHIQNVLEGSLAQGASILGLLRLGGITILRHRLPDGIGRL